jgi:hypothetical protein
MRQTTDTRQATILHSYATERDAVRAIAALRADGFGAQTIAVLGRHRRQEQAVAQVTGVTPLTAVHVGRVLGGIVGGVLGLLVSEFVAVMPAVSLPVAVTTIVVLALVGGAVGSVVGGIVGVRAAVSVPEHATGTYVQRFAAGDLIVLVEAGDRAAAAEQNLAHGPLPHAG